LPAAGCDLAAFQIKGDFMTPKLLRDLLVHAEELVEKRLDEVRDYRMYGDEDAARDCNRQIRYIEWDIKRARRELLKLERQAS
jgi:hypothetical protein